MGNLPRTTQELAKVFSDMSQHQGERLLVYWWASKEGVREYRQLSGEQEWFAPPRKKVEISDDDWYLFLRAYGEGLQEAFYDLLDEWWANRDEDFMAEYADELNDSGENEDIPPDVGLVVNNH